MAISVASLTSGQIEAGGSTAVTASISPSANKLVLLAVSCINFANFSTISVSGNGLTWVQVDNPQYDGGAFAQVALFRAMGAAPTSGAVTITFDNFQDGVAWSITEFGNVDTSGTNGRGS